MDQCYCEEIKVYYKLEFYVMLCVVFVHVHNRKCLYWYWSIFFSFLYRLSFFLFLFSFYQYALICFTRVPKSVDKMYRYDNMDNEWAKK